MTLYIQDSSVQRASFACRLPLSKHVVCINQLEFAWAGVLVVGLVGKFPISSWPTRKAANSARLRPLRVQIGADVVS